MSKQVTKFCSGVARRVGEGFGNPVIAALLPLVSQLFVAAVSKLKCLRPDPTDATPVPLQRRVTSRYNGDPRGTLAAGVPVMQKCVLDAARQHCKATGKKFVRQDYLLSDADAEHLVSAHMHEAIGTKDADAAVIIDVMTTERGDEPVLS